MAAARRSASGALRRFAWAAYLVSAAVVPTGLIAAGCAGTGADQVAVHPKARAKAEQTTTSAAPDCAQSLPIEAQAAQLLLVMVTSPTSATKVIADGLVGGFGLKGNQTKDVGDQIAAAVRDAPIAPFVGADEEGGTVQRLRLALGDLPSAAQQAKGSPEDAAKVMGRQASGMKRLGFNVNFAPVADVGSGSGLGTRSYGTDPATVSKYVDAVWPAIRSAGLLPVLKHWPGIGGGTADPHQQLTRLADISTLRSNDLVPFDRAIDDGAPAVMVTHAEVPGLTGRGEPASLSSAAITGELRGRERFDGLVMTDSLGMGAIAKLGTQAEAAEKAITAGADVAMLSGTDVVADAHKRLVDAITSGRIPSAQVLASVRRVLKAKGVDGPCLDAVARYSALARPTTTEAGDTTATPPSTTGSTTVATSTTVDTGVNG